MRFGGTTDSTTARRFGRAVVIASVVAAALVAPLATLASANSTIPTSEIPSACLAPEAILIERGHLVTNAANGATRLTRDISGAGVAPGRYTIELWSYDDHIPGRATQLNEQWRLELRAGTDLLYSSGPSDDLADDATINATVVGADIRLERAPDTLTAIHAFEGEIADGTLNSVIAVCAVLTPIPEPITVAKLVDADGDGRFQASEPRAEADAAAAAYEVTIDNPGSSDVTIESLVDDRVGDLAGQGTCVTPAPIPAGGTYTCRFDAEVPGQNAGAAYRNIVTATTSTGDEASAAADVVFVGQAPSIRVAKSAVDTVPAPSAVVDFRVAITNTSSATDPVVIESLTDDMYGSLLAPANGDLVATSCAAVTIAPGATYECVFTALVEGSEGDRHVNTVTVAVLDDEREPTTGTATHDIELSTPPPEPEPQVALTDTETIERPTITGEFSYIITFFNSFTDSTTAERFVLDLPGNVVVAATQGVESLPDPADAPAGTCLLSATESQTDEIRGVLGVLAAGEAVECRLQVVASAPSPRTVVATVTLQATGGSDQEPTVLKAIEAPSTSVPEVLPSTEVAPPVEAEPPSLAFTGVDPAAAIGASLALLIAGGVLTSFSRPSRTRRRSFDAWDDDD